MARSVNKVFLLGNLGKDAETKYTPNGTAYTRFSVATERRWKNKKTGEWETETDWHNCVVWDSEKLAEYLTKGQKVHVEGRLQSRSYDDRDGNKRYVTEIVCEDVALCGSANRGERDSDGVASRPRGSQRQAEEPTGTPYSQDVADDDVPF